MNLLVFSNEIFWNFLNIRSKRHALLAIVKHMHVFCKIDIHIIVIASAKVSLLDYISQIVCIGSNDEPKYNFFSISAKGKLPSF